MYEVKQVGPRAFEAKATQRGSAVDSCDASGGINTVNGYLTGRERD